MGTVKVAIIDNGVSRGSWNEHKNFRQYEIKDGNVTELVERREEFIFTHGTICSYVFAHYAQEYELYSLKIIGEHQKAGIVNNLIIALDWCLKNKIELINMSIGSIVFEDFAILQKKIQELIQNNIIIVAACNNDNKLTYPAALNNVIGVKCDDTNRIKPNEYEYICNPIDGIQIVATSECDDLCIEEEISKESVVSVDIDKSNSYTVPFITAKICNMMSRGVKGIEEVKYNLLKHANIISENDLSHIESNITYKKNKNNIIQVPNIVIYNFTVNYTNQQILNNLIGCFRKDGFNCIGIASEKDETCIENGIYSFGILRRRKNIKEQVQLIDYIVEPDIVLTIIEDQADITLLEENEMLDLQMVCYEDKLDIQIDSNVIKEDFYIKDISFEEHVYNLYRKCIEIIG